MYQETRKIATAGLYSVWELKKDIGVGGRSHTVWGPDINGRECRMGAYRGSYSAFQSMRQLHLADLKKDLKRAKAERDRSTGLYQAIMRLVDKLENEIKTLEDQ